MPEQIITPEQLYQIFAGWPNRTNKGATMAALRTITKLKMNKGGRNGVPVNPFIDGNESLIEKHSYFTATLNFLYGRAVERQREREGHPEPTFEVGPRSWGTRISGTPLVEYNGKYLLEVLVTNSIECQYFHTITKEELERKAFEIWLPPKKAVVPKQETEKPIIPHDYYLEGIVEVRMDGQVYKVNR